MAKRYYEGAESKKDSGMLSYDHSAVANLPQNVKYISWPTINAYLGDASPELDDTIKGIDSRIAENTAKGRKHKQYNKY